MEKRDIKVTDRRMFTEDGELREEYRSLDSASEPAGTSSAEDKEGTRGAVERSSESSVSCEPAGTPESAPESKDSFGTEPPSVEGMPAASELGLIDLIGMLAESVALYLGDVRLPDGRSAEDLRQARAYIDLLGVLEKKTRGNRSAEEDAVLGDLLYRLRVRYVEKQAKPS